MMSTPSSSFNKTNKVVSVPTTPPDFSIRPMHSPRIGSSVPVSLHWVNRLADSGELADDVKGVLIDHSHLNHLIVVWHRQRPRKRQFAVQSSQPRLAIHCA